MQPASHYSSPRSHLDVAILSLVMDLVILGPIILFNNTSTANLPILTFIAAVVLIVCCFLVKLSDMQGDNAAFTLLLKKMAEDHTLALEAEQRARDASQAGHKRTQAKLHGRLLELREARSKANQTQAGLRASEAKNRSFISRLAACADERDTAVSRLVKARAQRDAARGETGRAEEEIDVLTGRLDTCGALLHEAEDELAVKTEQLGAKEADTITLVQSLAAATAQRDAAKKELDAKTAAMAEQGVRNSERAMHMVGQTKVIAELRDLLSMSRDRIDHLRFELEVRLQCATSMKAEVVRLTEEVAFLQRSMGTRDSATSTKMDAGPATPSSDSTGTMSTTLSPSISISSTTNSTTTASHDSSSNSISDSTWGSVKSLVISPLAPPSPANATSEVAPAVVHTGAHNRPGKKQRRRRQGGGQTQQGSAKSMEAKRQTLSRYFCSA